MHALRKYELNLMNFSIHLGAWSYGKKQGAANVTNNQYNFQGFFSKGLPLGPGKMSFPGCQQRGEYILTDVFVRNNGMLETYQETIWRCTALDYIGALSTREN